ncbi:unnamed protein product [Lactuca virosa]|uniref:Uncharacterized protein n=1 Tax=Lactuca virosa TaxID=75947 RepID=A0AAU9M7H3_9ASTR|nr:unnamed protein product [Lactuca virosa]
MSIAVGVHRNTIANRLLVVEAGVLRNHIAGEAAASDEVQYKKPTDDCHYSPLVNCVVFAAMHDVCDWEKPPSCLPWLLKTKMDMRYRCSNGNEGEAKRQRRCRRYLR